MLLWVCFASLVTVHVALALTVGQRRGGVWGWLGLLMAPLLPYLGLKVAAKKGTLLWSTLLIGYLVLLLLAVR